MQEHVHTGFVNVLFAGISAIVVIQVIRLLAAQLVANPATEGAGKTIGALVTFS